MHDAPALWQRHLANLARPIDAQDLSIYADDLRVEFPFAPDGHTQSLVGPVALGTFLANIAVFAEGHRIDDLEASAFPGGFVIEYRESSTFRATGRPYASHIVWTARVKAGKIVGLREYYHPLRVLEALGE